jgi:hypothetical protein
MLRKWQFVVKGIDLLLFQPVDFVKVGLHDPQQAGIVETVQAIIGNSPKPRRILCAPPAPGSKR